MSRCKLVITKLLIRHITLFKQSYIITNIKNCNDLYNIIYSKKYIYP